MYTKQVSGPYPLSCITCRERRKKCDRTHPTCNRCKAGGFTCLGYTSRGGQNNDRLISFRQENSTIRFKPNSESPPGQITNSFSDTQPVQTTVGHSQSTSRAGSRQPQTQYLRLPTPLIRGSHNVLNDLCISSTHSSTYTHLNLNEFESAQNNGELSSGNNKSNRVQLNQSPSNKSPFDVGTNYQRNESYIDYRIYHDIDASTAVIEFISRQYTHAFSLMAFELSSSHEGFVQSCVLATVAISKSVCWSLFVGAKVYRAAMLGYGGRTIKPYTQMLDEFASQINSTKWEGMIIRELSGWLLATLELVDLRFLIDPRLAQRTLHLAVPIFVQITQAEPAFFQGNSSGPSLHIVLLSAQANAGLARFATVDIIGSFIFGSPQMILWDPAFVPELARLQWDEWIPGCPLYFMLVLCTINIWRGQHPHTRDLNEWIQLEHNVQTWQPQQTHCLKSANSWRTLGRLAVQEAFRHMTLIYLYMGVGTFRSIDPRVQASCDQISRLCNLVEANPDLSVHLFFPAIAAGVCARKEKHRSALWKCVNKAETCKSFLFKGVGFSKVLGHLWHGPASNGTEIIWEDYLALVQEITRITG
ncbi:hypothetical protein RSOLAG1IB_01939 [Rhizoctonia solani AG-1 IB]|uniref:Zn(2)-C6 fungal-type domain-containing protein n=1 Tax=Thanatephorus cucumeris (strain AG1-IB / isolate 7/3/14) TaxID=1108050 RepID=A0A0B7FCZ4_THACB|nr:hypothetical protein RSOLAG1IB_01939 [Rhizoctonia solani AG-1 IB]